MGFEYLDWDGSVQFTSYVYPAEMDDSFGSHYWWDVGEAGRLDFGRWYRIDNYVRMNTPGESDGVLRGWVDGTLALNKTDFRFRDVD